MTGISIYEFDVLAAEGRQSIPMAGLHWVPAEVFAWLETQVLRTTDEGAASHCLRLTQRHGQRVVQVKNFVGVIRAPGAYQIEVLPKVGRAIGGGELEARRLLIDMLRCLGPFRHMHADSAHLAATRMPLFEIFIAEFLAAVAHLVKRGVRSTYTAQQDNLFALRGKLQMATHLRQNLCRRDRFFTEFDEFSPNRVENRIIHSALRQVMTWSRLQSNQRLDRELGFVFADIPLSENPKLDFQRLHQERGMAHYDAALAWARLILAEESPLTGMGTQQATSLLFPMEALFEAFVARHLQRQLQADFVLRTQVRGHSLVRHQQQNWFRLAPDLLIKQQAEHSLVLDTKWKLLDASQATGAEKYGLAQSDFYQLYAYGQYYLKGQGDVVLIYPRTDTFSQALPVFEFLQAQELRLWVLPFCLSSKRLLLPPCRSLDSVLKSC